MTHRERIEQYLREGRTVSGGKGDDTLKQQEQAQAAFTNTLMQSYQQQFAKQSSILDFLTSKMKPLIENPKGFSPQALATMRTQASDTNARQFTNASQALNTALTARTGATTLPSGVDAQLKAELASSGAANEANSQNEITLQDENLKQQNFWNALNVLGGNAAMFNPTGYANSANAGSGEVSDLGTAYKNSQSSQLLGALGGIAGGIGAGAAAFAKGGCWIAAACFDGWTDPRTILVREWLNTEFIKHWYGRLTMSLYLKFGERVARSKFLVRLLRPLFLIALTKASN